MGKVSSARGAGKGMVKSPTSTRTEVRSPTSTETNADTKGNFTATVTGGAGKGANTTVHIHPSTGRVKGK